MGFFKKKPDPISERARALAKKIAALESEIQRVNAQQALELSDEPSPGDWRSTVAPQRAPVAPESPPPPPSPPASAEPLFEELDQKRLKDQPAVEPPNRYNELGIRKYDLPAAWRRLANHFRGPPPSNPKLVNYLAAGSIQGLRPLRYEKRIARNRFLFFLICLVLVLLGVLAALMRR